MKHYATESSGSRMVDKTEITSVHIEFAVYSSHSFFKYLPSSKYINTGSGRWEKVGKITYK
jgi:hypothetical protein